MIVALFITVAVVSMPIVAIVVVTMASHREDTDWSLGQPAQGAVRAAARRLLDFHSDDPAWPLPKNCGQAGPVAEPRGRTLADTPRLTATSKVSVGTAA